MPRERVPGERDENKSQEVGAQVEGGNLSLMVGVDFFEWNRAGRCVSGRVRFDDADLETRRGWGVRERPVWCGGPWRRSWAGLDWLDMDEKC